MSSSEFIRVTREGGVCHLQIDRVQKKNALIEEMYRALAEQIRLADADEAIGAILLSGAGGCFTAGNDIHDFRARALAPEPRPSAGMDLIECMMVCQTPIVAAVQGLAIGIGTTLLLHCDFVLAGRSAVFRTPFVDLGLCPEAASSFLMPLMIGFRKASELLLAGEALDAETAWRCDLVNRVVEDAELDSAALALAQRLAAKPRASVVLSKQLMRRAWATLVKETLDLEREQFGRRLKSPECRAALDQFLDRKK